MSDLLVPGSGFVGARLFEAVRAEWARNASRAMRAAERTAGMGREDLEELLTNNPETIPLFVQVLHAAGANGHDRTLRTIGAALGLAVTATRTREGHAVAEIEGALRAIRDFDSRHFEVLDYLIKRDLARDELGVPDYSPFSVEAISEAVQVTGSSAESVCLALAGGGLASPAPKMTVREGDPDGPVQAFFHDQTAYLSTALGRAIWHAASVVVEH